MVELSLAVHGSADIMVKTTHRLIKRYIINMQKTFIALGILLVLGILVSLISFSKPKMNTETLYGQENVVINNESNNNKPADIMNTQHGQRLVIKTSQGDIELELFTHEMPITTKNFVTLVESGFYDGVKFHRVIPGFMVQAGDPLTKDNTKKELWGTGGPGYTIQDEFVEGFSNVRGTIAMANTGQPNSGGSQFFINVVDNTPLDFDKAPFTSKHPVFGKVIEGMDVVDAIANTPTEGPDRPVTDVVIQSITLE